MHFEGEAAKRCLGELSDKQTRQPGVEGLEAGIPVIVSVERRIVQPCGPGAASAEARSTRTVGAVPLLHFPSIHRGRARTCTWGRPDGLIGLVTSPSGRHRRPALSSASHSIDRRSFAPLIPSFWSLAFCCQTPLRAVVGMPRPVLHLRSLIARTTIHQPRLDAIDPLESQITLSPSTRLTSSTSSVPVDSVRVVR
ncbi:hypothetical protein VTN00DRAFT_6123 [Thermoascus crustaceus]|uniref:uncharacterized protein n=1 Tax=Thermoascus crustaceus TaxID=5088 RepID=UPI0037432B02